MDILRSTLLRLLSLMKQHPANLRSESKEFFRRPLPRHCISFCSPEGKQVFREALLSGHMESYFSLASQLCTQEEPAHCGLATLTMIFNALELDPGRIWKGPWRWYHESMLKCCLPPDVITNGIVLDKFVQVARCNGLDVDLHRVYPGDTPTKFRELLLEVSTGKQSGVLVVSYERTSLGQTGSGHFAPVGGYHPQRELVFLFDTARFKYPSHWVPLARLWAGMRQIDPITQLPRGFLLLKKSTISLTPEQLHEIRQELKAPSSSFVFSQTMHAEPMLRFFSISDGVRQAYLSPFSMSDNRTAGFRLRLVAENWIHWLKNDPDSSDRSLNLIEKALIFFVTEIEGVRPTSFFFSIRPLINNTNMDNSSDQSTMQHSILRDLIGSSVGQLVSKYIDTLPPDFISWLATEGPFRLTSSFTDTDNSLCPFVLVSDPKLRITVILSGFLLSFPYNQIISQCTSDSYASPIRLLAITKLLEDVKLSDLTRSELQILENTLWSMIQKGDISIGQQCAYHASELAAATHSRQS